jgi:hypothetical protein
MSWLEQLFYSSIGGNYSHQGISSRFPVDFRTLLDKIPIHNPSHPARRPGGGLFCG